MTEKRFTTDNGSNEDVCLIDNITGKEYESNFDDIVDLLNEQNETINNLQYELMALMDNYKELKTDEKQLSISFIGYKQKVEETLQKRYNHLQKTQQETGKPPRYWQGAIMEIEVIADCLGVDLND